MKDLYCVNCDFLPTCTRYPDKKIMLMYCNYHSSFLKLKGFARKRYEAKIQRESLEAAE